MVLPGALRAKTGKKKCSLRVPGFRASALSAGIKDNGAPDMALIVSDVPATVAGLFTTNVLKAAPVLLDMERAAGGASRGIVINSGNANACTGSCGMRDAVTTAALAESSLGLARGEMLVASTGVIGVPLPMERIKAGVPRLAATLEERGFCGAGEAILTTDAFTKTALVKKTIGGKRVSILGIAKGAGMINPDMATMLAFFMTDAALAKSTLKSALKAACRPSFNSIMVDNDTSTNDTVLIFANGKSGAAIKRGSEEYGEFSSLLTDLATRLAKMIVKDGEGATRFVEILIEGAASDKDARRAARTIAGSYLVKTAFFGADPNWGRVAAAIGRAGVKMDEARLDISFNNVPVAAGGVDTGAEKRAARAMKRKNVLLSVNLNMGRGSATFWTTDLGYEYVKINSAYRT
ncbi:MAG: bifunctional glutamate N-acetyltransferase/amino-acid acetyltransferase ArgJ [Thermodesulfobacteriota bacterium]